MITIDFSTLDQRKAAAQAEKKEIVYVIGKKALTTSVKVSEEDVQYFNTDKEAGIDLEAQVRKIINTPPPEALEQELWQEYNDQFVIPMKKLSSQIAHMVERGATQQELADHYASIESYRPGRIVLYDKIQHLKQYGQLPAAPEPAEENLDPYFLKDRKKKLVDKRCKLNAKLKTSAKASKPEKILEWEQELAQANIEYSEVVEKIKQVEGKA